MAKAKEPTPQPETKALDILLQESGMLVADEAGRQYVPIEWGAAPEGGENDEVTLRLAGMKLLNSNSAETKKGSGVDAKDGDFYNKSTGEVFESIEIVPLYIYQERYYSGNNRSEMGKLLCASRDGKAKFGQTIDGHYDTYGIPTAMVTVPDSPRPVERGVCDSCPHSIRSVGERSACQLTKHLVCVHKSFLDHADDVLKRIIEDDPDVYSDILNNVFTVIFKSTGLTKLQLISGQAARDGAYFRYAWRVESEPVSNDQYTWTTYRITKTDKLTDPQMIVARSLYKFVAKVRPVITDFEVMDMGSGFGSVDPNALPAPESEVTI